MSYCMFRNTEEDLGDCLDAINEELNPEESRARLRLVRMCERIVREYEPYTRENDEKPKKK